MKVKDDAEYAYNVEKRNIKCPKYNILSKYNII